MKETNDTLAQLVTRLANGRSQAELEAACGGVPSRSRNRQIMKHEVKAKPFPEIINGLARGLGVPPEVIIYASANGLDYRLQQPSRLASLLPAKAEDLDDTQIAAVRAVVSAMNSANASRD